MPEVGGWSRWVSFATVKCALRPSALPTFRTRHAYDGVDRCGLRALWEAGVAVAEARERVVWHEAMADRGAAPSDKMQVGSTFVDGVLSVC